jgi:hypothetical protein
MRTLSYVANRPLRAARFLDGLEVEHIVLHALSGAAALHSFRTAKLAPWVLDQLDSIKAAAKAEQQDGEDGQEGEGSGEEEDTSGAGSKALKLLQVHSWYPGLMCTMHNLAACTGQRTAPCMVLRVAPHHLITFCHSKSKLANA